MKTEPRWGPIALVLVTASLLYFLPGRMRVLPLWAPYAGVVILLVPMLGVQMLNAKSFWTRVERLVIAWSVSFTVVVSLLMLGTLVRSIVFHTKEIEPVPLLASTVAIWAINLLTFTLVYWALDDGGPERRLIRRDKPDFVFTQSGVPDLVGPAWRPAFADYLFLAFTASTAFSPTDTLPITARAKMLMMLQHMISLVIIVVVAARAIGLLQ